jgi:hypothetical protein
MGRMHTPITTQDKGNGNQCMYKGPLTSYDFALYIMINSMYYKL